MGIIENNSEEFDKDVVFAPLVSFANLPNSLPSKKRKDFKRSQHYFSPRASRRSLPGLKQVRRQENLKFLISQLEEDADINESGEVDLVDLLAQHRTAFTELFLENKNMSTWNEFMNQTEEDQRNQLDNCHKINMRRRTQSESAVVVTMNGEEQQMAPELAFQRISHRLRRVLCKRQFPKGELSALEEELVEFFIEDPDSIYMTRMQDGFRRLLLHAVSQYLNLDAYSINDDIGKDISPSVNCSSTGKYHAFKLNAKKMSKDRLTYVENPIPGQFSPPITKLVDFLDNKIKSVSS